jgi:G3E family GTPase
MSDEAPAIRQTERLPVSVLTGFLGSGKTTLLKHLLTQPGLDKVAVIVNEFGEIGLDHTLIESSSEGVVLLNSGCLCCTVRGDLIDTMRGLFLKRIRGEVPEFDRVVIETTGLADPAPILHTLMSDPLVAARFRLDGVVTTVDAVHGMGQLDAQQESVKQAAVADRLVLTKTDLVDQEDIDLLTQRLRKLNPAAPIETAAMGRIDPRKLTECGLYDPRTKSADVRKWLNEEAYAAEHGHAHGHDHEHDHDHDHDDHDHDHDHARLDVNRHDEHIRAFCLSFDKPFEWAQIAEALDLLAQTHGPSLLRVKGILNVVESEKPIVVHGVQHLFHPPATLPAWPPGDDKRSRLVFITRDLDKTYVEKALAALFQSQATAAQ